MTIDINEMRRRLANVEAYDDELNALEIPPNGDDFNAVMEMLRGGASTMPTKDGR